MTARRWLPLAWLALCGSLSAAELTLTSPSEYQVIQRRTRSEGTLRVVGSVSDQTLKNPSLEVRIVERGRLDDAPWSPADARFTATGFEANVTAPAGGWHRVDVRVLADGTAVAERTVEHVGVGEVFVVAGQSNSANHGEERTQTETKRVASFDGSTWRIADDPQPGASGNGGSFMPSLGDSLVKEFDVPIGFVACGIGATSVREWLPQGATFPNPPTIEGRVAKRPDGTWQSNGAAFATLVARMKSLGPQGYRAVLWHQGESDANQKDPSRTLPGPLYREYLETVIRESRREIGWDAPWFVAQVSYHVPGDESSPDVREAQASLAKDGIALAGPDSDALKGTLRERNGQGVHFSAAGLKEHGAKWAERLVPWLEHELAAPRRDDSK